MSWTLSPPVRPLCQRMPKPWRDSLSAAMLETGAAWVSVSTPLPLTLLTVLGTTGSGVSYSAWAQQTTPTWCAEGELAGIGVNGTHTTCSQLPSNVGGSCPYDWREHQEVGKMPSSQPHSMCHLETSKKQSFAVERSWVPWQGSHRNAQGPPIFDR
jgi:hypothetical protein